MVSKRVIIKSLVCTALTCSFATYAFAADKDNGETVQSSWMDRTDSVLGYKVLRKILIMIMQCLINK